MFIFLLCTDLAIGKDSICVLAASLTLFSSDYHGVPLQLHKELNSSSCFLQPQSAAVQRRDT